MDDFSSRAEFDGARTEFHRAKDRALRLLGVRSRTREEIRARLQRCGFETAVIEGVIEWLGQYNYVDDARFARDWVQERMRHKPMGRRRLALELREKGVAPHLVDEALAAFDFDTELELAREAVRRRIASLARLPPERQRSRLYGYLSRRGFSSESVRKAVAEALRNVEQLGF